MHTYIFVIVLAIVIAMVVEQLWWMHKRIRFSAERKALRALARLHKEL